MFAPAKQNRARPNTGADGFIGPPLGGLNTVDPAGEMPPTDAMALQNLIPAEMGLRARLGSMEWVTGLDGPALTAVPFNGAAANGAGDRFFVTTATGIWDCSASTASPVQVFEFASSADSAGLGVGCVMVTSAGHFLAYCDEVNGYHLYTEATAAWQKVVSSTQTPWASSTAYALGDLATNDSGKVYRVITAGTSAGSGGPTGTAQDITDGTVHWAFNQSVSGVDPANFVNVLAWKNRLWFTQGATAKAWYLGINSIGGAATSFNFGGQFKIGGPLVGLWNWTTDGGIGMDDYLVALSGAGDVVVYQGTDPATAGAFGLRGVWTVGALPAGRNIATGFGGDILIASLVGVVPLSQLVLGTVTFDRSQYLTRKVQNLFNYYTGLYGGNSGWSLRLDPKDNALLVLVPIVAGAPNTQLAMSLATKGWFPYSGLPMNCAASWDGTLYFGTTDGRVLKHDGYVDEVLLSDPSANVPVQWNCLTSFQNLGSPKKKRVHFIRPKVLAQQGAPPVTAAARFDFDVSMIPSVAGGVAAANGWDSGTWDSAVWGGDYSTAQPIFGATGIGSHIAIAIAGLANSRTVLAGADVSYGVGGLL